MRKYYPITLHLHSVWERQASMAGHFHNAQKLGIHHMYITDHDTRMGPRGNQIDHFDFSKGELKILEPSKDPLRPRWHGFTIAQQDEGTNVNISDGVMHIEANSDQTDLEDWSTIHLIFDTSQKRHEYALLANTMLHLGMNLSKFDENSEDVRIIIDVKLSQRPPEFENAHIYYVFGNTEGLESPYITVKSMKEYVNDFQKASVPFHKFAFELLKGAEAVGGADNILNTVGFIVSARKGQSVKFWLDHLSITWDMEFEEGRKEHQKIADEVGKKYGVTPFVTSEITGAGRHKICFSTKVPIINYRELGFKVSDEEAMEHVRRHGGIFARNHPFDHIKDKVTLGRSAEEINEAKQGVIKEFIDNRAWGAAMMEVGFPAGKSGFPIEDYLKLWDKVSAEGIFISGYGDSDSHSNKDGWFDGNNFVGYIAAENPCEDEFVYSMKAGNLYTGDPVYLQHTEVSFVSDKGQMMGQVTVSENPGEAVLTLQNVPEGCQLIWIANGETVKTEICNGNYKGTLKIPTDAKVNFVRAALYKGDRCILLTNPLYQTIDADVIKNISVERKYNHE